MTVVFSAVLLRQCTPCLMSISLSLLHLIISCARRRNKYYHLTLNMLLHYLVKFECLTVPLYSSWSVQNDGKSLFAVNVYHGCYSLIVLFFFINLQLMFKMSALSSCICFKSYTPMHCSISFLSCMFSR